MESQAKSARSARSGSWSERLKAVRDDPEARFRFASGHLPRKQAFREVAIALRGLIRLHCDDREAIEGFLALLYRFAALQSLTYSRASDQTEDGADRTVLERFERMREVDVPYADVGSEHLLLLTKTDRKLMAQLWGKPARHVTPRAWLDGKGPDPEGVVDVAKLLRGDEHPEGLPAETALRRRASDRHGGAGAPDLEELKAEEAQQAEDAVFGLMAQHREAVASSRGATKRLAGWATGLLESLGL